MPSYRMVVSYGEGSSCAYNATWYARVAGGVGRTAIEATAQSKAYIDYEWSHLFVRITSNTMNNALTAKTRKNGLDGNQSISVPATTTGVFEDLLNSDSLTNGDLFNYMYSGSGTSGLARITPLASNLTGASGFLSVSTDISGAPQTIYTTMFGANGSGAEPGCSYPFCTATRLTRLRVYILSNDAGAGYLRTRINGSNGTLYVSIPSSTSGAFEDITNSDDISIDDKVNYVWHIGGVGGWTNLRSIQCQSESSTRPTLKAGTSGGSAAGNTTRYAIPEGSQWDGGDARWGRTTEVNGLVTMRGGVVATNLFLRVSGNQLTGASIFRNRKNGADGALSVSIPAATTGDFHDSGSDSYEDTDNGSLQIVAGSGSGALYVTFAGFEQAISGGGYIWVENNNLCYTDFGALKRFWLGTQAGATGQAPGYLWVEGVNLRYIDSSGDERYIAGVKEGATGQTPGQLWLESDNKLHYIDSSGDERTILGTLAV